MEDQKPIMKNNNEIILSIIIPAYNVENTIERTMKSVINNLTSCIEVILVNDGSVDNTRQMVEKYSNEINNLYIINQNNQGSSSARNKGMSIAKGEFLYFLDAGDLIENDIFKKALEILKKDIEIDVLTFNSQTIYEDEVDFKLKDTRHVDGLNGKFSRDSYLNQNFWNLTPVWIYIIKASLLKNNKINFVEGILAEDNLFYANLMTKLSFIYVLPETLHSYIIEKNSITTIKTKEQNKKFVEAFVYTQKYIEQILKEKDKESDILYKFINYRLLVAKTAQIIYQENQGLLSQLIMAFRNKVLFNRYFLGYLKQKFKKINNLK